MTCLATVSKDQCLQNILHHGATFTLRLKCNLSNARRNLCKNFRPEDSTVDDKTISFGNKLRTGDLCRHIANDDGGPFTNQPS